MFQESFFNKINLKSNFNSINSIYNDNLFILILSNQYKPVIQNKSKLFINNINLVKSSIENTSVDKDLNKKFY